MGPLHANVKPSSLGYWRGEREDNISEAAKRAMVGTIPIEGSSLCLIDGGLGGGTGVLVVAACAGP